MSGPRYFFFWCERCPTRVRVETELPAAASGDDPEYSFATSEWVGQAHVVVSGDDYLVPADRCPACGGQLHDLDQLVCQGDVPPNTFTPEAHAAWRERARRA